MMNHPLAVAVINNYANVKSKVTAAMSSNSNLLAERVVSYVNSLPEITDEQAANLIEFLTRKDLPPLEKFDCVRELTEGSKPARGKLVSKLLAIQLSNALPLFEQRENQKKEAIRQVRCTTEVGELPEFLSHEDIAVVEEAKLRMVYLNTCTEEEPIKVKAYMPIHGPEAKRLHSERRRLVNLAQDLFIAAKDPYMPERWRKKTKKKAEELLAAREKLSSKLY